MVLSQNGFQWVISISCAWVSLMFPKIASHSIHMKCTFVTCAHFIFFKIRTNNFCNSSQDKLKHLEIISFVYGQKYFCTDKSQKSKYLHRLLSIFKFPITKQIIWLFTFSGPSFKGVADFSLLLSVSQVDEQKILSLLWKLFLIKQ